MIISVKFERNDFAELLSPDRPYGEEGLAGRLRSDLTTALENRLRAELGEALVHLRITIGRTMGVPSRPGVHIEPIIAREVLEKGGLQAPRFCIMLSTARGVEVNGFVLEPPVVPGYPSYPAWEQSLPEVKHRKATVKRERRRISSYGFWLPTELLPFKPENVFSCACPLHLLTPDRTNRNIGSYIVWICNICGSKYVCECCRGVIETISREDWRANIPDFTLDAKIDIDIMSEIDNTSNLYEDPVQKKAREDLEQVKYIGNICHLCRGIPSTSSYALYSGRFLNNYRPYVIMEAIRSGITCRDAENRVREQLGIPRVGEAWVSETHLYHIIRALFPQYRIEREASPDWLGSMRFDIYMPEVGVAVEYQGEQHFQAIKRFGGESGFEKTRDRDRVKRKRAAAAGVDVVDFRYDEPLTEERVYERLVKLIRSKRA